VEIHAAARKHSFTDDDIRHAVAHAVYAADLEGPAPLRVLYLGPDQSGNLMEVVVVERDDGSELAIHAMKMQRRYRRLLEKG